MWQSTRRSPVPRISAIRLWTHGGVNRRETTSFTLVAGGRVTLVRGSFG